MTSHPRWDLIQDATHQAVPAYCLSLVWRVAFLFPWCFSSLTLWKGRFNWQMGGERDMTVAKSVTEKCDRKFLPVLEKKAKWHLIRYTIVLYKQVKGSKSHKGTVRGAHSREGQGKQRVWNRDYMEGRRSVVQPSFRPTRTTVALRCYFTPRKDVRELLLRKLKNVNLYSVAATEGNRCC